MSRMQRSLAVLVLALAFQPVLAERINQEGRILGTLPTVTNPILFNTTNADAVVGAMQILPVTNPWNECITNRPVLANSDAMIAQIVADLTPIYSNRRTLRAFKEMNYVLVPDGQATKTIQFLDYPSQSDFDGGTNPVALYPIPTNMPVETWPSETEGQSLTDWQQDANNWGGDRHSIIVKPGAGFIWETWQAKLVGNNWEASNGAKFNLNTNGLRPAGWTSGDAAGFPMFPALVRYDECERGMVEHAMRILVKRTRYNNYIYPATHWASYPTNTSTNLPSMGQRLRLKSSYVIPSNWTKQEKAMLLGLKKYGAMVADNGNFFSISVTPDDRWPAGCFDHLNTVGITNFEVIVATGLNEGPRSPGAPTAKAGTNQAAFAGVPLQLQGFVNFTNTLPPVIRWSAYSGPTNLTFANAALTNSTVTFNAPGVYTLMLSANDRVHAVAYDAAIFNVTSMIAASAARSGTNLNLTWTGGAAPFVIERTLSLPPSGWTSVLTTGVQNVSVPISLGTAFFRVRGN